MRKVEPLGKALQGYTAWVTGIRRVEAPTRANAPLISWDKAFELVKINPIAAWTDDEMQAYIDANDVLVNPACRSKAIRRSAARRARRSRSRAPTRAAAAGRACRRRNAGCTLRECCSCPPS